MSIEIVFGPPGTGKTTTLLGIVEDELARGVAPDQIGFVTFTRRGADEAAQRATKRFGLSRDELPWFRTLHSLCFRRLGMSQGDVFEGRRIKEFADYAGIRVTGGFSEDGTMVGYSSGDRAMFLENLARVRVVPLREAYDQFDDALPWNQVERVARSLEKFKADRALMDFTDMLAEFVRVGEGLGLDVLIVDEAQDLSRLQWDVVRVLASGCRRVVVAGDDDQAIYAWAGADAGHLIRMEGEARVLDQSWRVPRQVQDAALEVIQRVSLRRPKTWAARQGAEGVVDREVDFSRVDVGRPWGDGGHQPVLVLARNTYVVRDQVEPTLRHLGIVYEHHGHPSISRKVLGVVDAWEDLRRGKSVSAADARLVYEQMSSGRGVRRGFKELKHLQDDAMVTMDDLERDGGLMRRDPWHDALDRLPRDDVAYIRAARQRGEDIRGRPRVRVSTIHGSKGGEAEHVVVLKEMARRTHAEMMLDPDAERRVWYVAATRARERLTVVESATALACPWM